MDTSILTQHLLVSLVPWLVGVLAAAGLGYVSAPAVRGMFSRFPALQRLSVLLPWRTIALTLPLLSPWVGIRVGLGSLSAGIVVALFVFLLAFPLALVSRLEKGYTSPFVRYVAWSRTLAVASVAVAAVVSPTVGAGGAGPLIFDGMRTLDYAQMLRGFIVVVVVALMIDLVLGALQLLLSEERR